MVIDRWKHKQAYGSSRGEQRCSTAKVQQISECILKWTDWQVDAPAVDEQQLSLFLLPEEVRSLLPG